jgi:hypothetical protein
MDDEIREFGITLGKKALGQDWDGVRAMLAPWLSSSLSSEAIRNFFEDEYKLTLSDNDIDEMHYPESPEPDVDGNNLINATELRKPLSWDKEKLRLVADEVTDENMRCWMKLQLQCSDQQIEKLGFDQFCEIWMAIVQTAEGLRVGYWSHGAY